MSWLNSNWFASNHFRANWFAGPQAQTNNAGVKHYQKLLPFWHPNYRPKVEKKRKFRRVKEQLKEVIEAQETKLPEVGNVPVLDYKKVSEATRKAVKSHQAAQERYLVLSALITSQYEQSLSNELIRQAEIERAWLEYQLLLEQEDEEFILMAA